MSIICIPSRWVLLSAFTGVLALSLVPGVRAQSSPADSPADVGSNQPVPMAPGAGPPESYSLFTNNRADKIRRLVAKHKIEASRWIWEDPKDIKFESLGPFVGISEASGITPDETAELIRVRYRDGSIRNLIEDKNSIVHHLSQLNYRMSRLYVVGPVEERAFARIQTEVRSWEKPH